MCSVFHEKSLGKMCIFVKWFMNIEISRRYEYTDKLFPIHWNILR